MLEQVSDFEIRKSELISKPVQLHCQGILFNFCLVIWPNENYCNITGLFCKRVSTVTFN